MASIQDFTLQCDSMVDPAIGAILSLIPFVKTLRTLRITLINSQDPVPVTSNHLWYWLEYALHHPNSATSTCEQLALDFPPATEQDCILLEDVLTQRTPERSQGLLQANTVTRRHPATFDKVILTVDKNEWFEVCFWESHDDWIGVVVPESEWAGSKKPLYSACGTDQYPIYI